VATRTAWTVPAAERLLIYFCQPMSRAILLVFLLVSAATGEKNHYDFKLLWY
jgi:hypothetical protein